MASQDNLDLLRQIYPVSRETFLRFEQYFELLKRWQAKTNLVSPKTLSHYWKRHVADSLQLYSLYPEKPRWTDLGSGGGFPGLIIAIMLAERRGDENQQVNVNLVESIQKKCAFLRQVANSTGVKASIYPIRIELARKQIQDCDIITARALAPLPKLFEWTAGEITGSRIALFPKGRDYLREIEESRRQWRFDLIEHASRIDPLSRILEISNVERLKPV